MDPKQYCERLEDLARGAEIPEGTLVEMMNYAEKGKGKEFDLKKPNTCIPALNCIMLVINYEINLRERGVNQPENHTYKFFKERTSSEMWKKTLRNYSSHSKIKR